MKTFISHFSGKDFGKILSYPSRTLAGKHGNGFTIFSDEEDLIKNESLTLSQMVTFYNHHNSTQPVKSFADRATAAKRIFTLAQAKAEHISIQKETPAMTTTKETVKETVAELKKAKAKAAAPKKETTEAKRGRKSEFTGVKIFPAEGLTENPRREGGFGYKAMAFIMENPGVTYEAFIEAGGRRQDLAWDLAKGNVTIKH
jgi:hypothetical protein